MLASPSTLSEHLRRLENVGIVESARIDRRGNDRDAPESFFYFTDAAQELFDRNNLFDEEAYRAAYQEIEKPDDIIAAENAPRPEVNADTVTN